MTLAQSKIMTPGKGNDGMVLHLIVGCTAVGKTEYAVDFAERTNSEILSCDSLLVYKHVNIGAAKPTRQEMARIKHHCMDLVEPCEKFDVAKYIVAAKVAIDSALSSGKNVIVVGGSGFYLKSFYYPVIDEIVIPESVTNFVASAHATIGLEGIGSLLVEANGGRCPPIDMKNPRRVMASLGRCLASGKTFDQIHAEFARFGSENFPYARHTILFEREKEDLRSRVWARTKKMIGDGLIDEVKFLLSKYDNLTESVKNAIGYRETIDWLQNPTTEGELVDEISKNTMKLIKKQKTWFKNQIPVDEKILLR
jgi:tRNA dimethylallyltransferase